VSKKQLKAPAPVKWFAWISLLAAFIIGQIAAKPDHQALLNKYMPGLELSQAEYQHAEPVVFYISNPSKTRPEAVLLGGADGYGGPLVVGIRASETEDSAVIHEVVILDNKETPPYIERLKKQYFFKQFERKDVRSNFFVDEDIDGYSGATVSAIAIAKAVRQTVHLGAVNHLKMEPSWKEDQWNFGINEIGMMVLIALAFFTTFTHNKLSHWIKLAMPIAAIVFVGFYTNTSVSLGNLAAIVMGYIPSIQQHPMWWILMGTIVASIVLFGRNMYCNKLCPFAAAQDLLHKISGFQLRVHPNLVRNAPFFIKLMIWVSLMLIFLSRHPALGSYEPFSMMFALEGMGMQWYILPLSLIGGLFVPQFWCRLFCPVGVAINETVRFRRDIVNRIKGKPSRKAREKANAVKVIDPKKTGEG
jgi:hypothetical protein